MASRIVQYFADKLRTVKEYPITLTKAIYDESGKRLDNKLQEIDNSISDVNNSLENYEYAYEYKTISSDIQIASMKYGNIRLSLSYPEGYNFIESITPILNLPGQATIYDNGQVYNICVFNCTDTTRTYTVKVLIKYTKHK